MSRLLAYLMIFTATALGVACSHQWRESNSDLNSTDLQAMLTEAQSSEHTGDSGAALSQLASVLQDHDQTTIYFADGPRKTHGLNTVMLFSSLSSILPAETLKNGGVIAARVFFVDHAVDHNAFLIVGVMQSGNKTPGPADSDASSSMLYYSFQGKGVISGGEYNVTFVGADGNPFVLRSRDVKGGELTARIQLRAYTTIHGANVEIGKFPSLTGYQ